MNSTWSGHTPKARRLYYLAIILVGLAVILLWSQKAAHAAASGDAYVTYDSATQTWSIGTALGEQKVKFNSGKFLMTSFYNKSTSREYVEAGMISDEFRLTANGTEYTGNSGGYTYDSHTITTLSAPSASPSAPGAIRLAVVFHNSLFQVTAYYEVYPSASGSSSSQSLVKRWFSYKNISGSNLTITNPYIMNVRVMQSRAANLKFASFQGGGHERNYSPQWVDLTAPYYQEINSDTSHITPGIGHSEWLQDGSSYDSPFYVLQDKVYGEGIYLGFNYLGLWQGQIGNKSGSVFVGTKLKGLGTASFTQVLANNGTLDTPNYFMGVFKGDIDNVSEQLYDWQYVYKWDYTLNNVTDQAYWNYQYTGNHEEQMFKVANVTREVGGEAAWDDAGWYDMPGNWLPYSADYKYVAKYLKKSGINFQIWMTMQHYDDNSTVIKEHPTWATTPVTSTWAGNLFDLGNSAVTAWMKDFILARRTIWDGAYSIRLDGVHMAATANSTYLQQYNNFIDVYKNVKIADPTMMVESNAGGGEFLDWDMLEAADTTQLSDTNPETIYYAASLYPYDKFTSINGSGDVTNMTQTEIDGERKRVNINNYFKSLGILGRYSKVYHPAATGALHEYDYLQHMTADRSKAIIDQWYGNGTPTGAVTIYPKALNPTANYTVTYYKNKTVPAVTHTGTYWMTNGIPIATPAAGEIVLLNVPNLPGRGTDVTAPTAPTGATKKLAGYLGHAGVEINWNASTDSNWLGYYEILRGGTVVGKVSKGTFYFDATGYDINSVYTVRALDLDGNTSTASTAASASAGNNAAQAALGFSGTQGTNNWRYQEWNGSAFVNMAYDAGNARWYGSSANAFIGADWIHPGTSTDSARVYTVQQSGRLVIESNVHKGNNLGDGDNIKIMKNGTQIWPASGWQLITSTTDVPVNLMTEVNAGDSIVFYVNRNGTVDNDYLYWNPVLSFDRVYYKASVGFSATQGTNNWRYQQWNGTGYADMAWDGVNGYWKGTYANTIIANNWQHPDTYNSVRVFVAPQSGTITISGTATKSTVGGDGVSIRIMKNGTQIWPASGWRSIAVTTPVETNVSTAVTVGDKIYFELNQNGTITNDGTLWDPVVAY